MNNIYNKAINNYNYDVYILFLYITYQWSESLSLLSLGAST